MKSITSLNSICSCIPSQVLLNLRKRGAGRGGISPVGVLSRDF